MRIIGGNKKGKRILVARKGIRPTKGLVREAILQVIQEKIQSAQILDIFAGSGALGLEALSRGASGCVFIERVPTVLYKNIKNIAYDKDTTVIRENYTTALKRLQGKRFAVIFLDPPYARKYVERTITLIATCALLEPHGIVVVEHDPHEQFSLPDGFELFKHKRYGDTAVTYLVRKEVYG
ncbi:16S rRNA (guanine(966)-N(2))-methyltransferase RsmD [candidate division WOR-3 bacterium]|nr:16S rRNA (guanine(966)-N(2))-methyltransferase RsmD [candidate division WOR-3 bacterium]